MESFPTFSTRLGSSRLRFVVALLWDLAHALKIGPSRVISPTGDFSTKADAAGILDRPTTSRSTMRRLCDIQMCVIRSGLSRIISTIAKRTLPKRLSRRLFAIRSRSILARHPETRGLVTKDFKFPIEDDAAHIDAALRWLEWAIDSSSDGGVVC